MPSRNCIFTMNSLLNSLLLSVIWFACVNSSAQAIQSWYDDALINARSLSHTNLELRWLDTVWIENPPKAIRAGNKDGAFNRTFEYSYVAAGEKYYTACKLVSASSTNVLKLFKAAFDGTSYSTYTEDTRYATISRSDSMGSEGDSVYCPLVAPFLLLTKQSDSCMQCILRFSDIASEQLKKEQIVSTSNNSNGPVEISIGGPSVGHQPTKWTVLLDRGDNVWRPKVIQWDQPGKNMKLTIKLLGYTNLMLYNFPSRIEWTAVYRSLNSPAATGVVTVVAMRIPDHIDNSLFTLDNEKRNASVVWDWDRITLVKSPSGLQTIVARTNVARNIVLSVLILTTIIPLAMIILKQLRKK